MPPDVSLPTPAVQRFVQLPADTERPAAAGFEPASTASRPLDLPGGAAERAELLAALVATLHRYTQQAVISLDVHVAERRLALDFEVEDDARVSSLVDRAKPALGKAAAAAPRDPAEHSNVLVTFDGRARPDRCDVQFVFSGTSLEV